MYPTEPTLETPADAHENLLDQVEAVRVRLEQLERTLSAVAHDAAGVRIAGPCTRCDRSLLLVKDNSLTCPACHYHESL